MRADASSGRYRYSLWRTTAGNDLSVDTVDMHYKEYVLKGIFHHAPRHVQTAINLLSSGAVDGSALATEVRPLGRLIESLEDMAEGKGSKYILVP